eukprot:TRINITY_DN5989_c0_g1_i3.p1 TRINITY_DN5989_c0_g1~~TRINITY_DN5989_c0_g1_i3.p1  ORF type:complete len:210 (+),score=57.95 TRINITY_DN5989_c0_g1_i3:381-1010(+)
MIIMEYPNCLDLEFCEGFLSSINDRIDLFTAYFHPLTHIETNNAGLNSQINKLCNQVKSALDKVQDAIAEISKRAELSVPLLKKIEDSLNTFRSPFRKVFEEVKKLKDSRSYSEYKAAFNEFLVHASKESSGGKGEYVRKMIQLIKEICLTQLKLETILDTPIKLSQLIKNKGKKLLNEDMKPELQNKLLKYINTVSYTHLTLPTIYSV